MLGDRLAAGRRVLAPLTQVRILVPQPILSNNNGGVIKIDPPFFVVRWWCGLPILLPADRRLKMTKEMGVKPAVPPISS